MLSYLTELISNNKSINLIDNNKLISTPSITFSDDGDFKEIYSHLSIKDHECLNLHSLNETIINILNNHSLKLINQHLSTIIFDRDSEIFNSIQLSKDDINKFINIHNCIATSNYKPYINNINNSFVHPYASEYWRKYSGIFLFNNQTKLVFPTLFQKQQYISSFGETSSIIHIDNIPIKLTYEARHSNERRFILSTYTRVEFDPSSTAHLRLPYKEFSND